MKHTKQRLVASITLSFFLTLSIFALPPEAHSAPLDRETISPKSEFKRNAHFGDGVTAVASAVAAWRNFHGSTEAFPEGTVFHPDENSSLAPLMNSPLLKEALVTATRDGLSIESDLDGNGNRDERILVTAQAQVPGATTPAFGPIGDGIKVPKVFVHFLDRSRKSPQAESSHLDTAAVEAREGFLRFLKRYKKRKFVSRETREAISEIIDAVESNSPKFAGLLWEMAEFEVDTRFLANTIPYLIELYLDHGTSPEIRVDIKDALLAYIFMEIGQSKFAKATPKVVEAAHKGSLEALQLLPVLTNAPDVSGATPAPPAQGDGVLSMSVHIAELSAVLEPMIDFGFEEIEGEGSYVYPRLPLDYASRVLARVLLENWLELAGNISAALLSDEIIRESINIMTKLRVPNPANFTKTGFVMHRGVQIDPANIRQVIIEAQQTKLKRDFMNRGLRFEAPGTNYLDPALPDDYFSSRGITVVKAGESFRLDATPTPPAQGDGVITRGTIVSELSQVLQWSMFSPLLHLDKTKFEILAQRMLDDLLSRAERAKGQAMEQWLSRDVVYASLRRAAQDLKLNAPYVGRHDYPPHELIYETKLDAALDKLIEPESFDASLDRIRALVAEAQQLHGDGLTTAQGDGVGERFAARRVYQYVKTLFRPDASEEARAQIKEKLVFYTHAGRGWSGFEKAMPLIQKAQKEGDPDAVWLIGYMIIKDIRVDLLRPTFPLLILQYFDGTSKLSERSFGVLRNALVRSDNLCLEACVGALKKMMPRIMREFKAGSEKAGKLLGYISNNKRIAELLLPSKIPVIIEQRLSPNSSPGMKSSAGAALEGILPSRIAEEEFKKAVPSIEEALERDSTEAVRLLGDLAYYKIVTGSLNPKSVTTFVRIFLNPDSSEDARGAAYDRGLKGFLRQVAGSDRELENTMPEILSALEAGSVYAVRLVGLLTDDAAAEKLLAPTVPILIRLDLNPGTPHEVRELVENTLHIEWRKGIGLFEFKHATPEIKTAQERGSHEAALLLHMMEYKGPYAIAYDPLFPPQGDVVEHSHVPGTVTRLIDKLLNPDTPLADIERTQTELRSCMGIESYEAEFEEAMPRILKVLNSSEQAQWLVGSMSVHRVLPHLIRPLAFSYKPTEDGDTTPTPPAQGDGVITRETIVRELSRVLQWTVFSPLFYLDKTKFEILAQRMLDDLLYKTERWKGQAMEQWLSRDVAYASLRSAAQDLKLNAPYYAGRHSHPPYELILETKLDAVLDKLIEPESFHASLDRIRALVAEAQQLQGDGLTPSELILASLGSELDGEAMETQVSYLARVDEVAKVRGIDIEEMKAAIPSELNVVAVGEDSVALIREQMNTGQIAPHVAAAAIPESNEELRSELKALGWKILDPEVAAPGNRVSVEDVKDSLSDSLKGEPVHYVISDENYKTDPNYRRVSISIQYLNGILKDAITTIQTLPSLDDAKQAYQTFLDWTA